MIEYRTGCDHLICVRHLNYPLRISRYDQHLLGHTLTGSHQATLGVMFPVMEALVHLPDFREVEIQKLVAIEK